MLETRNTKKSGKRSDSANKTKARLALAARLAELFEEPGVAIVTIAQQCEVSVNAVYGWRTTGRVAKSHLVVIARLCFVNLEWLLTGTGQKRGTALTTEDSPRWPTAGERLATLFDSMDPDDQRAAWPWLVRMLAKSPAILKAYLAFPADGTTVAKRYGKTGSGKPKLTT